MAEEKFIDVEKVIANKNPKLLKWMPGFLLRYIKRIIHEDEMNAFMAKYGHLRNLEFNKQVLTYFNSNIIVKGIDNIPANGGCIIASNHPLGGFDGMAFMQAVSEKRKDIRFLVNDILFSLGTMNDLFVPVNKHGAQYAMSKIEEAYQSENAVLIFPAGLVSRKQEGEIKDLLWKKSFIVKSKQYDRPIIPTHIDGKNSKFFYNLGLWRKRFGIKANIEMFYLVDEMFKQRGQTITITFGQPVYPASFPPDVSDAELAGKMKEHIYQIGSGKTESFKV
jgi:1-acyl-sn-glycerol-3-phosphate acyltransferase